MAQTERLDVSDPAWRPPTFRPPPSGAQRAITPIVAAICLIAAVGVAVGLRMALHATPVECPNGTIFYGAAPHCYEHRHAGQGTAIVTVSAMLALLTILVGVVGSKLMTELDELHTRSR